jgi:iron complex outermembrane recepter protein
MPGFWPVTQTAIGVLALGIGCLPMIASAQEGSQPDPEATQGGLGEIVVTAQRRAENLQSVPIAVSAINDATLKNTGIQGTADLPQLVPSVQMTRSGPSGLFFIRGVGTTNAAAGEEGANAVYIDNVYLGDLTQTFTQFNNIERVEVLKGPQGTLFGRNATGGLIHIITRDPPQDGAEFKGQFGAANFQTASSQLYVGTPITDTLSADIAYAGTYQNKGWGRNLTLDEEIKVQTFNGLRSKAVFRPNSDVKIVLSGDYSKSEDNLGLAWKIVDNELYIGGITGPEGQDTTADYPALSRIQSWGGSLTGEFDLGFATLTSVSAMRRLRNQSYFDVDGGPANIANLNYVSRSRTYQQELRLASNGSGPLAWQAGLFYLRSEAEQDSTRRGSTGLHTLGEMKTDSYAAFAEATYSITPTTHLTGGLRYTIDDRRFDGRQTSIPASGVPGPAQIQVGELKYEETTYRLALRQEVTDDLNLFASVNRGFKAGAFSLTSPLNPPIKPQFIMAYEAGVKSEWLDRKLRVNVSAYHYKIDDYQVRSATLLGTLLQNAAVVKVDGIDLEFEAAPTSHWRVFGGVNYTDSRYGKFGGPGSEYQAPIVYPSPASCPPDRYGTRDPGVLTPGARVGGFTTCFGDVSGNRTPLAPEWALSLGSSLNLPTGETGELRLTALYSYNSGYVFDPDNRSEQGDFHMVNASVEYRPTQAFGIEIWGRNLTNTEYSVQKLTTSSGTTTALASPRTYGVNFKFDF